MKRFSSLFLILIITLFITSFLFSCKSPTAPGGGGTNLPPGRRDYTWTADTIKIVDALSLNRIYGITPTDVWVTGVSSWTATTIWHYDGNRWGCDSIPRNISPWAVIGFSSNEVWIGNANSTIWKYDGSQWQLFGTYNVSGYDQVVIQNFDGLSGNNIYGVGYAAIYGNTNNYEGIIMHYDGTNWSFVNIPSGRVAFGDVKIDGNSGDLVLEGTDYDSTGWISKIDVWDGKSLKEIYSGIPYANVGRIQNQVYVTIDGKVYNYNNGQLILFKDLSGEGAVGKLWCGRSESDFFMWSAAGGIGHYNGNNFKILYKFNPNMEIGGGYIFEKDVFFLVYDPNTGNNIIVHGKLN